MSLNDGLTIELDTFLKEKLAKLPDCANEAIIEIVDKYANSTFNELKKNTPRSNNSDINIADRLVMKKITARGSKYYGYSIKYEGEFKSGTKMVSYAKMASIMNYGSWVSQKKKDGTYGEGYQNWQAHKFITRAVKKLKKMTPEINDLYIKKEKELMKNG